jgi:hypothetical protein
MSETSCTAMMTGTESRISASATMQDRDERIRRVMASTPKFESAASSTRYV